MIGTVLLTGCNKEPLKAPEVKTYEVDANKEEMTFSEHDATVKDPIPAGEKLYVSGDLKKQKYETVQGEYTAEVIRVMRNKASEDRIVDEDLLPNKPGKGQDWVMIEIMVRNLGKEDGSLAFIPGEIGIYTKKGKEIPLQDVGLNSDYQNIAIYQGKPEKLTLTVIADKKEKNFLIGFDNLADEYEIVDGKKVEEESSEDKKDKDEKDKEEEENKVQKPGKKYLATENAILLRTLDPEEAKEQQEIYDEYRKEEENKYNDFEVEEETKEQEKKNAEKEEEKKGESGK